MRPEIAHIYAKTQELFASQQFDESLLDYKLFDRHIPFLHQLDEIGNTAVSVFDLYRRKHVYTSERYRSKLGVHTGQEPLVESGLEAIMHPEDMESMIVSGYYFMKLVLTSLRDKAREYRLIQDFRIMDGTGGWLRVVEQHLVLETDPDGRIWLSLSLVDASPDQDSLQPHRARLVHKTTGGVIELPADVGSDDTESLSKREKEILSLIAEGYISKQIADKLYVSVHTVNTHRQNILEKLNAVNTAAAIRYASELGILNSTG